MMLRELDGKIIDMNGSVLGFTQFRHFELRHMGEDSPFAYLQCVEDEDVGFVVASPFSFFSDYEFELPEAEKNLLKLTRPEEALVLGIITLKQPFEESTMNLIAPIVINVNERIGRQIVLPPKYDFGTKHRLFVPAEREGGVR